MTLAIVLLLRLAKALHTLVCAAHSRPGGARRWVGLSEARWRACLRACFGALLLECPAVHPLLEQLVAGLTCVTSAFWVFVFCIL